MNTEKSKEYKSRVPDAKTLKEYALAGALGLAALTGMYSYFVPDKVEATILDCREKDGKYLIFTDNGVFENTDALYRGKLRSSDMQAKAMAFRGQKASIESYGFRNGLLSWYHNVVGIEKPKIDKEQK